MGVRISLVDDEVEAQTLQNKMSDGIATVYAAHKKLSKQITQLAHAIVLRKDFVHLVSEGTDKSWRVPAIEQRRDCSQEYPTLIREAFNDTEDHIADGYANVAHNASDLGYDNMS